MPAKGIHPTSSTGFDVAVIGGGVIGLSVAWRARSRGLSVLVLDRGEPGGGTSRVAAGMLAPASEADAQERALLALGLESARLWPPFAAELQDVSGLDVGLRTQGTLAVARDGDEKRWLERELDLRERLALRATRLLPSAARALEPALAPSIRLGVEFPDDYSADPRALVAALVAACERAGVVLAPHTEVTSLDDVDAAQVVLAAGRWRRCPCVPSRDRRSGYAASRCWSARCASRPATSCRAWTAASCSARRWRSAASTPP
jgi:glycine oxidase